MAIDPARVKFLFQAAIELTDPGERGAFLDHEASGDAELRGRLDALLAVYDQPPGALDRPLGDNLPLMTAAGPVDPRHLLPSSSELNSAETTAEEPSQNRRGDGALALLDAVIAGRYKLRQAIGEGGMGTVYFAEQIQPVRRQVALKLIRAGMDSRTVLARFESERQALALMDHPNIARVLDAGTTESGHPFFVMELVKGIPLTDFCDQHRLDLPTRLNLFRQICSAVQHAHQKGIIHRDLKPTNILVEDHAGTPVPKVIDFGLAKATSGLSLTEASLFTAFGTIAGTPLYMAPEQATFNSLDVDTRADIYALGVILYELLTGSTPIRKESLQRAALDEVMRVIREEEAQVPSHRISTSEALPSVAATRQVEPIRLGRFVRGDLDWIVMKALAKDRSRRYDSAVGLANDIERFLKDEPVTAGPPTARYRTAKFIRRHRGQVVAASLIVLALIGGVVGTTLGLIRARTESEARQRALVAEAEQRREAQRQEALARTEATAKEQARQLAERRLAQVGKMNEILGSIFEDLDVDKGAKEEKPLSALLGERLDVATAALAGESIGDPLAVARMQRTLGKSQTSLDYPAKAVSLLERSVATLTEHLGSDHTETLITLAYLGRAVALTFQHARAVPMQERAWAELDAKLGPDHLETLRALRNLIRTYRWIGQYERAVPLAERVLERNRAKLGPNHPNTLLALNELALIYTYAGHFDRAIPLQEQALAGLRAQLGPDHPDTSGALFDLGLALGRAGRFDEAIALHEEALTGMRAKLGSDHFYTLAYGDRMSSTLQEAGQFDRAIALQSQNLEKFRVKYGPDNPSTFFSQDSLAASYRLSGRFNQAVTLHEQALAELLARLGSDHSWVARSRDDLGLAYAALGQHDRAISLLELALAGHRANSGPDSYLALCTLDNLACAYRSSGRLDRAIPLHEQALDRSRVKLGPDHPLTFLIMGHLAVDYRLSGQLDRAVALHEPALKGLQDRFGPDHPDVLKLTDQLALTYGALGQHDRAISLAEQTLGGFRNKLGPDHPDTRAARDHLIQAYQVAGQPDRANRLRVQAPPAGPGNQAPASGSESASPTVAPSPAPAGGKP